MKRSLPINCPSLPRPVEIPFLPGDALSRAAHEPGLVFFDSAGMDTRFSFLAARPSEVVSGSSEADWLLLEETLARHSRAGSVDCGYPAGFAAGCVEYDGSFQFGFYDDLLVFDHALDQWLAAGNPIRFREPVTARRGSPLHFKAAVSKEAFCEMVLRAREYISAGDIYQVNLSHRLTAEWDCDPIAFYSAIRHYSPAPYAAYIEAGGRMVLSSSPEQFLLMSGRQIRTRPIKGTRPRRADPQADEQSAYELITSGKELAELVMITDLERNDLGAICEYGSVHVPELLRLERHAQVFHLASTVQGELRGHVSHVAALRRCFPGGSITGAPKKRAREIIAEIEPEPRGIYTGAIGYFGFNGESQFNIAIRTVVIEDGLAHFHVGAGIVADSVPAMEFAETMDKAAGILLAADRMNATR